MGVNVEIVVLFDTPAEAATEARELAPLFDKLFSDMLRPRAYGCALVVSGLTRYASLDPGETRYLGQWPIAGLAIRILARQFGLDRVRYGNDAMLYIPYHEWEVVTWADMARMDRASEIFL